MKFPLHRVQAVHLSGGMWIPEPGMAAGEKPGRRLLDDHVHDVPDDVFELLSLLASRIPQSLDVIIERDGAYPDFSRLLSQLDSARAALQQGRAQARPTPVEPARNRPVPA